MLGIKILIAIGLVGLRIDTIMAQLFKVNSASSKSIIFKNELIETPKSNVLTYEYFFNGGGVAAGDINNDGLDDIYFTSNMQANKLYLNLGGLAFKDITIAAGVSCELPWKSGVTMADVNGDGWLDIYVCYSGRGSIESRRNKLFINNHDLTFTERAKEFGLDDPSYSTQASFFDFDNDGDLDMYLLNHNVTVVREFEFANAKATRHPFAGDKLFRNDGNKFTDVSVQAGIKGSALGFGLGVTVSDLNKDGWMDMYISNDYIEPDYLYINNKDGTFTDQITNYLQHLSYFSMGSDIADINNDGWPEIYTVDMLPDDNKRQKLLYGPENYEQFALMVINGFYFQTMRNMLHLNNQDGTFSEIGQLAGVSNTDWSWAPLIADFDNDGLKDLFITNGYYRDYTNRDFLKYKGDYYFEKTKLNQKADTFHLISTMTSTPLRNYIFKNKGNMTFENKSTEWGFNVLDFSSGACYSDLDRDGDLDLIVNRQNEMAIVYENGVRNQVKANFLAIDLKGRGNNKFAIGAKIYLYTAGGMQYIEKVPTRGFQSSISQTIHFGLGSNSVVDSVIVHWPGGSVSKNVNLTPNRLLVMEESGSLMPEQVNAVEIQPLLEKMESPIQYQHIEYGFNDFKRQPLLLNMLTTVGPIMTSGDINSDGLEDVFVGGTQNNPGKLFRQLDDGRFDEEQTFSFQDDVSKTDSDAAFFDADNDGDLDLYVVSGGYNDYNLGDKELADRLYINDGKGKFAKSSFLPQIKSSKSCIAVEDFDRDGDVDVFLGGRVIPGRYPEPPNSYFLVNNGKGIFQNEIQSLAPALERIGMVSDAAWVDLNLDGWKDLVLVGEYMTIEVFENQRGRGLIRKTKEYFGANLFGFWNSICIGDFDKDGDDDIVAGNFGLNSQLKASENEPLTLYYADFDNNGSIDPILEYYVGGKAYPFPSRDEMVDQMYPLRKKFANYASYSEATISSILDKASLEKATKLKVNYLSSTYFQNNGGEMKSFELPLEAQFSPIFGLETHDFNNDGNLDFVAIGNQSSIRIRLGAIDANFGQVFLGDGSGGFRCMPQTVSGLNIVGDAKSVKIINTIKGPVTLFGINNVGIIAYKLRK